MASILLVAPGFFGYYKDIMQELEARGYEVDRISDRPSESVLTKSLGRISYDLLRPNIRRYHQLVCDMIDRNQYDLVLFVGGMSLCFDRSQLAVMKSKTNGKIVLYLWDSVGNCQRVQESLDLFDKVYSFERTDCEKWGLVFLPLFFATEYGELRNEVGIQFEFDACFIGSVHQREKFDQVRGIINRLEAEGRKVFAYYYMPSKSSGVLYKVLYPEYRHTSLKYTSLSRQEIIEVFRRSRMVIDAPQSNQKGLTMRTIEAVGAGRSLITTNDAIADYDFYNKSKILIARNGEALNLNRVTPAPTGYDERVIERYAVGAWVEQILLPLGL